MRVKIKAKRDLFMEPLKAEKRKSSDLKHFLDNFSLQIQILVSIGFVFVDSLMPSKFLINPGPHGQDLSI